MKGINNMHRWLCPTDWRCRRFLASDPLSKDAAKHAVFRFSWSSFSQQVAICYSSQQAIPSTTPITTDPEPAFLACLLKSACVSAVQSSITFCSESTKKQLLEENLKTYLRGGKDFADGTLARSDTHDRHIQTIIDIDGL